MRAASEPVGAAFARRVSLGVGSSALTQVLTALQTVLLVPLFLRAWGAELYGEWLALYALAAYLSLVDLGGQTYVGNLLTMDRARGDDEAFRRHLSEGVSLFLVLAGGALLLALGGVAAARWLAGDVLPAASAAVLALLLVVAAVGIPGGVYVGSYRATGLFARGTMVGNLSRLLGVGVSISLLLLDVEPVGFAAGLLLQALLGTALLVADTRRVIPLTRRIEVAWRHLRGGWGHLRHSIHFAFLTFSQTMGQQGVLLVLAALVAPVVVAVYATHRAAALLANYVNALFQGPLLPELARLHAQGRRGDLQRAVLATAKGVMLATGAVGVTLWAAAPLVFGPWTGGEVGLDRLLLALLLAQGTLQAGWATMAWVLVATNHQRPLVAWSALSAGLALGLAVLLAPRLGAQGAAAGVLAADLAVGLAVYPRLSARFLGIPARAAYGALARVALVVGALGGVALAASRLLPPLAALLAYAAVGAAAAFPLARAGLGRAETDQALALARRALARLRARQQA